MKGGAHPSPFAALSFPNSKKVPIFCWVEFSSRRMAQPSLELTRYGDFLHHSRAALTTRPRRLSATLHIFIYYPYELRQGILEFSDYDIKSCQINYMIKMYLIFEVLRLIGTVYGTARVEQIVIKYSIYGHLLPVKEKHLRESVSSDWTIIAKASCLLSSE